MLRKTKLLSLLALILALPPLEAQEAGAQPSTEEPAASSESTGAGAPEGQPPRRRRRTGGGSSPSSRIWWNQPAKIEALGLSEDQRSQMDSLLMAFLEQRRSAAGRRQEALRALGQALARGDWSAARDHGDAVVAATSSPIDLQIELMIEVVGLLTPEQRQALIAEAPRLLSRLWISTGRARLGGRER